MKTWEMIKELTENPKKKFVSDKGLPCEIIAYVNTINVLTFKYKDGEISRGMFIGREWEEVKEPLSFIEVLKAIEEGVPSYLSLESETSDVGYENWALDEMLADLTDCFGSDEIADILLNSKFYIND
ncbi:hypothetical protein KQI41_01000 [Tissierella pigra]|uniref:hypothetical protein n=1 Tax=Tissierella pigra TaxID=2607614 RepID=UPI001C10CB49|nr:hypothetical protein [Tissierella pigra]MBU5424972.1 hypothetical protein [Tissierella pigra]